MNTRASLTAVSILLSLCPLIVAALFGQGSAKSFEANDVNGRSVRLDSYLNKKRILLIFNPPETYLDELRQNSKDLAERDMQVVAVYGQEPAVDREASNSTWLDRLLDNGSKIFQLYKVPSSETHSFLIGKDAGIKQERRGLMAVADLFKTIDGMPMRRHEASQK